MALNRLANLSVDVNDLMNEEDENLWQEAGLIKNFTSLETHLPEFSSTPNLLDSADCRPSGASGVPLFVPVVLPGLVDSFPKVSKACSEFNPQSGFHGGVSSGSREGPKKVTTLRKSHGKWSSNKVIKKMVLGSDVGLEDTCNLAICRLVGRFSYGNMCTEKLSAWMEQVWVPVLGYNPELIYLTKGWLGFICRSTEDAEILLKSRWVNGSSSLMLKKWHVAFDPETEFFSYRHLWILLPGLPLYLWNEGALKAIGEALGGFVMIDRPTLNEATRKVGRILVEMDISQGLPETLEID